MKKILLTLIMLALIAIVYYSFTPKEAKPGAVTDADTVLETSETKHSETKKNILYEPKEHSPFWMVFNQPTFTKKKKDAMSEEEINSLINETEQLKREIYLKEGYPEVFENAQTDSRWKDFSQFILEHQSETTYMGEEDYSLSDILIAAGAPDEIIKKYIDRYPPTPLSVFSLVHTRRLNDSPQLVNRILSYFSTDVLLNVDIAGMTNVNLLQLAKDNDRHDILRFYDVTDVPVAPTGNPPQKDTAKNDYRRIETKQEIAHAPYVAKKITAKNSEHCKTLAQQSFLGVYGDTFSGFNYSAEMNNSIKDHSYHLQKYNQRKAKVLSSEELPKDFSSKPERYFYSTAIYKVLNDNGDDIKDSEYIPDLYGIQIATSQHFPDGRFTLLENLIKKTEDKHDRLSVIAYMSGGLPGLNEAVSYGAALQPDSGEDVLHWSYRNETMKETKELLLFLKRYNFESDKVHQAMHEFKASCIVK